MRYKFLKRFSSSLLTTLLLLQGCGTGTTTEFVRATTEPPSTTIIPNGSPIIATTPGAQLGTWSIMTTQSQLERTTETETTTWEMRRYVTFGPSILLGLFQCPIGGLAQLLSWGHIGKDLFTYGCDRLIGREPVQGRIHTSTTQEHHSQERTITTPASQLSLHIHWPHPTSPSIRLSTNTQGEALIQLSHLLTQWPIAKPLPDYMWTTALEVYEQNAQSHPIASIPITQKTIQGMPRFPNKPIDPQRLPRQWIAKVQTTSPLWQTQMEQWLLKIGWCVAANDILTPYLRDEFAFQRSGRVSERTQVPLGTWTPPTLLLNASTEDSSQGLKGHLSLLHIQHGELLRTWTMTVPTQQPELLFPLLLSHLQQDLPKPSTPCYAPTSPIEKERVIERTISQDSPSPQEEHYPNLIKKIQTTPRNTNRK